MRSTATIITLSLVLQISSTLSIVNFKESTLSIVDFKKITNNPIIENSSAQKMAKNPIFHKSPLHYYKIFKGNRGKVNINTKVPLPKHYHNERKLRTIHYEIKDKILKIKHETLFNVNKIKHDITGLENSLLKIKSKINEVHLQSSQRDADLKFQVNHYWMWRTYYKSRLVANQKKLTEKHGFLPDDLNSIQNLISFDEKKVKYYTLAAKKSYKHLNRLQQKDQRTEESFNKNIGNLATKLIQLKIKLALIEHNAELKINELMNQDKEVTDILASDNALDKKREDLTKKEFSAENKEQAQMQVQTRVAHKDVPKVIKKSQSRVACNCAQKLKKKSIKAIHEADQKHKKNPRSKVALKAIKKHSKKQMQRAKKSMKASLARAKKSKNHVKANIKKTEALANVALAKFKNNSNKDKSYLRKYNHLNHLKLIAEKNYMRMLRKLVRFFNRAGIDIKEFRKLVTKAAKDSGKMGLKAKNQNFIENTNLILAKVGHKLKDFKKKMKEEQVAHEEAHAK